MVGSALSFVWRRATRRQHRSSRSTDPSNRQCASVRSSGFGYRAGPPIPRRLAPPGARAAPRRLEPWWHTTTSSDPWRSGALECRPSLFMRGVPTRPADVGRRQFRPRIGLVRARKRCCARRRRRKKSRGGRRPRRNLCSIRLDFCRARIVTSPDLPRFTGTVRVRGILYASVFLPRHPFFDHARVVGSKLVDGDPRSLEGILVVESK